MHWTAYLSALLTPTVAAVGLYLAWRQAATARNKLKFDLFSRRFSVYDAARTFIATVVIKGEAIDDAFNAFVAGTREARWLFDEPLDAYLRKELDQKATELQCLNDQMAGLSAGEELTAKGSQRIEIKKWFYAQHDVLEAKCHPFLKLEH
ncbi:MAG: hypothetical protein ABIP64_15155 [Burkholderiales bacterium]